MSYRPYKGSIPGRVIQFLTNNPDEELSCNDIGVKFDVPTKNLNYQLAPAVNYGVLTRHKDGVVWIYRLGAGHPDFQPGEADAPVNSSTAPAPAAKQATEWRDMKKQLAVDVNGVKLEISIEVRVQGVHAQGDGAARPCQPD